MTIYQLNKNKYGTHNIIAEEIGNNKIVLDVGCNKGYLYQLAPNNTFYGIDFDEKALEIAKVNYTKVYKIDLNSDYSKFKEDIKFDVIVFADIIEHLIYPEIVLKYFVGNYLKKGGIVIVSLPNVAHFSIRLKLLFGKFDYSESGILDKTHLHLYTLSTAKKLLNDVELNIERIRFSSDHFGFLIRRLPFLGPILGFNIIATCHI